VELKAGCAYPDEIVHGLLNLGAQPQSVDEQSDVYYRAPTGQLKLRPGEIEHTLIHYNGPDEQAPKESQLNMVAVGSERALDDVLDATVDRDVVVTQHRHILWRDNVKFHVDAIAALGSFLEIEAIYYDGGRSRDTSYAAGFASGQLELGLGALAGEVADGRPERVG